MTEIAISQIKIGRRARSDPGDVRSLAESIRKVGLLHPVVVDGNSRLISGRRRIAAVKLLGWSSVPVTVAVGLEEAAQALRAERDENVQRLALKPTEALDLADRLEPLEREAAKERKIEGQQSGGRGRKKLGADSAPSLGKAREAVDVRLVELGDRRRRPPAEGNKQWFTIDDFYTTWPEWKFDPGWQHRAQASLFG